MQKQSISRLLTAAILTAYTLLASGCKTRESAPPNLPAAFQILKPGETVTYTAPSDCRYAIITTDKGLLYLQGIEVY